ncbi:PucR family transcriptional regulator [Kribbella sp. NPDC000426]|uniref:PucR family transcriptional regulator n=1 Tax=Kribbella sp. NPDC000426 TaxID=3154255 RepID=UPI003328F938
MADLLAVPELALAPVHLSPADAEVRWVATSELVDPTPYLEGGEVLLTTGLETTGWGDEWQEYVERLVGAGVAALGLGVGLTHEQTPEPLRAACEDLGFNLFEVPRRTTFVAISRTAATMIEAARGSLARRALDAQRVLTRAALEVDDEATLVRRLAALVSGAATIVTRDGEPTDGPFGSRTTDLVLDDVRSVVERIQAQGLRAAASSSSVTGSTIVRPLGVRSRPEAWLAVFVPGLSSDADRLAIATAASLLSLSLERRHERRATDRQLRLRAVELLLAGDVRTARIVLEATAVTGPKLPDDVRLLRARGTREETADALALLEDRRILATILDGELLAVLQARADDVPDQLAILGLQVGVGRAMPLEQSTISYDAAGHALAATGRTTPVRTWDDLVDTGVIALLGTDRATAFASSYLAPLAGDPILLETLATFLRHHGSRGDTATELGVHRNTVRNRITHIETLLTTSFDDPQSRVNAWIALQSTR